MFRSAALSSAHVTIINWLQYLIQKYSPILVCMKEIFVAISVVGCYVQSILYRSICTVWIFVRDKKKMRASCTGVVVFSGTCYTCKCEHLTVYVADPEYNYTLVLFLEFTLYYI